MRNLIAGQPVRCEQRDVDRFGRIVAVCFIAEGLDLGKEMVRTGWALAYRHYSTEYIGAEGEAQEARRGMWRGEFIAPWDWRRSNR